MNDLFVTQVRHATRAGTDECLGMHVLLWCPGCEELHVPAFRCHQHQGPFEGPVWNGDPYSNPFSMEPSLLVMGGTDRVCHSFIREGQWEFLGDSFHQLAGTTVPLVPLPAGLQGA